MKVDIGAQNKLWFIAFHDMSEHSNHYIVHIWTVGYGCQLSEGESEGIHVLFANPQFGWLDTVQQSTTDAPKCFFLHQKRPQIWWDEKNILKSRLKKDDKDRIQIELYLKF